MMKADIERIEEIAARAVAVYDQHNIAVDKRDVLLDLLTVHLRVVRLRLGDMLTAPDVELMHDVCGINRHLDRQTHKLNDCFVPRFADISVPV